jgi:hypothetical protein
VEIPLAVAEGYVRDLKLVRATLLSDAAFTHATAARDSMLAHINRLLDHLGAAIREASDG